MIKDSNRPRRVAELIRRELAMLIPRELDDPHAHQITITGAEVSRDMSSARIYYSLLGGAAEAKQTTKSLNRAAGFLRPDDRLHRPHSLVFQNERLVDRHFLDDERAIALGLRAGSQRHFEIGRAGKDNHAMHAVVGEEFRTRRGQG